ncbi:receptor-like protein 3 isoform X2 [Rosa rugosa]|uniref:receptor-like protein 3 isoform X2 n=1 Tax=Rosa rugosa TaxID=74645 RepID=UPI002B4158BE|nr:receptor-like protein 3 isoform X2 [Rosa rugosa]
MYQKRRNMLAALPYHPIAQYFLLILLGSILSTYIHACGSSESTSLLSFALTLSSPSLNWTRMDCCQWEGITCDVAGRVTHLHLSSKGLRLKGDQAGFFLSLGRLEVLDLSFNLLSGELPGSLSSSNNIRIVDLSSNRFHGAIPSSFFQQAKNLTRFYVMNNSFLGYIPSPICVQSSSLIKLLDFSYNKFGGTLSRGLGNCSKLKVFRAGYNNLSGSLPEDIYDATALEEIAIPANSFYGGISNRIVNLTNLTILDLYFNHFSGMLPIDIGKLSKLKVLLLHSNNLEGSLPPSLLNCTNLMELNLGFNLLKGDISTFNFSRLGQLRKLDFMSNRFTGILPISLYSCKSLRAIRLSVNNLEGQIQPEIVSLKYLSFLSLSGNRLTNITGAMNVLKGCRNLKVLILSNTFIGEEMPDGDHMADFDGFQNLRILALHGCGLAGQIPIWISKLKKLEILDMGLNRITGSIPTWLGTLPMLFSINLRSNLISGEIPKELCTLPMLVSEQTAAQVDHGYLELPFFVSQGVPDASILQFNSLSYYPPSIFLNNNSISGNIPTEIGYLQLLHILDLSANQVSGNIPDQISNLTHLETLDLSVNHLSGEIPPSMTSLNFLSSFNVSYNNLEGEIPKGTQLLGLNVSAFEGNPKLCGSPLLNLCQSFNGTDSDSDDDDKNDGNQILGLHISVVLGFTIGLVGFCGSLLLIKTWGDAYFNFLNNVQDRLKC